MMGLLAYFAVTVTQAQAPEKFKYQAVLRDATGNIIANTAVTVVIDILQGSTGGASVYQETQGVTTTAQGVINLDLGAGTVNSGAFAGINWSTDHYWVKVTLDGTVISIGQLQSVPYALSVKGINLDPSTGNIGIGTTAPGFKLDVQGVIHSGIDNGSCFQVGNDVTLNDINQANGIGLYGTYDPTIGGLKLGSGGNWIWGKNGYIGIGTSNPTALLHLVSSSVPSMMLENTSLTSNYAKIGLGNSGESKNWEIGTDYNQGNLDNFYIWQGSANADRFNIDATGNVGIGTTSPTTNLDVNGTIRIRGGSPGSGKVLSSGADGTASWATNTAITPAVTATLSGASWTWTSAAPVYTGSTLTLPPGKWSVQVAILISNTSGLECWVRSTFTNGSGISTPSPDIIGATLASGYKALHSFGMVNGTIIINNTSGSNKTYYYWGQGCDIYAGSFSLPNFGGSAALENQIIAYPMN